MLFNQQNPPNLTICLPKVILMYKMTLSSSCSHNMFTTLCYRYVSYVSYVWAVKKIMETQYKTLGKLVFFSNKIVHMKRTMYCGVKFDCGESPVTQNSKT